jgi:CubicO group peptidase (beta-lactamase class C family)
MALIANLGELDGVRLLSEETTRTFTRRRANRYEVDLCLGYVPPVGTAGIWVGGTPQTGLSPSIAFMGGVGGLVWADLERRVGGAILHNHVYHAGAPPDPHPLDPVGRAIDDLTRALTRQAT